MKKSTFLFADKGMVLTNGKSYGKAVRLAKDSDESKYYEITEAEYEAIKAEKEEE